MRSLAAIHGRIVLPCCLYCFFAFWFQETFRVWLALGEKVWCRHRLESSVATKDVVTFQKNLVFIKGVVLGSVHSFVGKPAPRIQFAGSSWVFAAGTKKKRAWIAPGALPVLR